VVRTDLLDEHVQGASSDHGSVTKVTAKEEGKTW